MTRAKAISYEVIYREKGARTLSREIFEPVVGVPNAIVFAESEAKNYVLALQCQVRVEQSSIEFYKRERLQ